jgi:FAD/FMN-containing dehydrogenase
MTFDRYEQKKQRLINQLRADGSASIGLGKRTSNLFRDRQLAPKRRLDVSDVNEVLMINAQARWAETEGMTTYADIVDATLPYGLMPTVVPELKSITIGGATTGVGIESSSFRHGLVHEGVLEMEVLLGDGNVVLCTPTNEHQDLFFGFPNSYGTLGYALKLRFKLAPTKPYVHLTHVRYTDTEAYFGAIADACREDSDFLDGTIFTRDEMYLSRGKFVTGAPYVSDYTFENIYYQSIRRREVDYLHIADYIWRWDTDWFWCSKHLFVQHPLVRALAGKSRLNSVTYAKIMRWNSKWQLTHRLSRLLGWRTESIIQDVDIPIGRAAEFLRFFQNEIGITPIWVCPIRTFEHSTRFALYRLQPEQLYINFGFWDVKRDRRRQLPRGYYNRQIERKVQQLGGMKSLYSDAYFPVDEFWHIYNKSAYDKLKAKYDPQRRLKNLYEKCVLKH